MITIDPMNMTIQLNSDSFSVSLSCEADGATSYYWERQNRSIPSKATGIDTATLVINYLQPDDAGNYRCIATNTFGSTFSRYATLVANGKCFTCLIRCYTTNYCMQLFYTHKIVTH